MSDTTDRNLLITELRRNGATLEQIAERVGISTQRVCCILQRRERDSDDGRGQGIPCPKCNGHSRTIKSPRPTRKGKRRRHICLSCGHRWSSLQVNLPEKLSTATDSLPSE